MHFTIHHIPRQSNFTNPPPPWPKFSFLITKNGKFRIFYQNVPILDKKKGAIWSKLKNTIIICSIFLGRYYSAFVNLYLRFTWTLYYCILQVILDFFSYLIIFFQSFILLFGGFFLLFYRTFRRVNPPCRFFILWSAARRRPKIAPKQRKFGGNL